MGVSKRIHFSQNCSIVKNILNICKYFYIVLNGHFVALLIKNPVYPDSNPASGILDAGSDNIETFRLIQIP
jgi:hypothetical protein